MLPGAENAFKTYPEIFSAQPSTELQAPYRFRKSGRSLPHGNTNRDGFRKPARRSSDGGRPNPVEAVAASRYAQRERVDAAVHAGGYRGNTGPGVSYTLPCN